MLSLFGSIHYRRAYYYCRHCGHGLAPFDEQAGLGDRRHSKAVEQLASLAGAVGDSFEKGADLLHQMAHVRLSESTIERTTEQVGHRIAGLLDEGVTFGPSEPWDWHTDARGRTVAYVSIDATGTRQQGPGGTEAEGRMAYVAAVYDPPPEPAPGPTPGPGPPGRRKRMRAVYLSGLYRLEAMGPLLRRQAQRAGMERADVWVALSDGGSGLEEFLRMNFNREDLVLILDFYHAASYLEELAHALHPREEAEAARQAQQWCGLLKQEGGATTLAALQEWDWPRRMSAGLAEKWAQVRSYFGNNVHRMEYPEYQAEGWQIGSGVIESACKTVVGQRLKGAGMRWSEPGAHALCHVRALYRSEQGLWQAFWKQQSTNLPPVQQLK